jgi:protein-tyrosine phosphatase
MQLSSKAAQQIMASLRPPTSSGYDLQRARGLVTSGVGVPSLMPSFSDNNINQPKVYVGSGAHASSIKILRQFDITAVINCAPLVCKPPLGAYKKHNIALLTVDAKDNVAYDIVNLHLNDVIEFMNKCTEAGENVLIHCMAGINRSATLAVAYILQRDGVNLLRLFKQVVRAREGVLQNVGFQRILCEYAGERGLLGSDWDWDVDDGGGAGEETETET